MNNKMELKNLKAQYAARIKGSIPPVYRNLGEQLLDIVAVTHNDKNAPMARVRLRQVVDAAPAGASAGVDGDGGFLIETDKARDVFTTAIETGVLSSRCTRQDIGGDADSYAYLTVKDRDRATRSGLTVRWKGETDDLLSSGKVELQDQEVRVEDMYGLLYVSERMLRDAASLASFTKRELLKEFSFAFDSSIFQGSGHKQCLGVMSSDLPVTVSKLPNQTAATIVGENVTDMLSRFGGDITKAAWFINRDCITQLPHLTIGNQSIYVPGGNVESAPFGTLLGCPIVPLELCSPLGTKGDIMLGDFSQYMLITKGSTEVTESIHVRFLADEMAFRFTVRLNGQPMHETPIIPLNGSNSVSPFVLLESRA